MIQFFKVKRNKNKILSRCVKCNNSEIMKIDLETAMIRLEEMNIKI